MKKKIRKILILLLIIGIGCIPLFSKAETKSYPKKGDIRCPGGVSNSTCSMYDKDNNLITNANSDVWKVVYRYPEKNHVITSKIINKTPNIGEYEVSFDVEITNDPPKVSGIPTYIIVIRDASGSMSSNGYTNSTNAAQGFANDFIALNKSGGNYNLALIQFGSRLTKNSESINFSNVEGFNSIRFCNKDDGNSNCKQGESSHIEKALVKAQSLLKNQKGNKHVVILGDGRYWRSKDTDYEQSQKLIGQMKTDGVFFHGILYDGGLGSSNVKKYCNGERNCRVCYNNLTKVEIEGEPSMKLKCDEIVMGTLTNGNYYKVSNNDYSSVFDAIKNTIESPGGSENEYYEYTVTDRMGDSFELATGSTVKTVSKTISYTIKKSTTTPFKIMIKKNSESNWHNTNNGFTVKYNSSSIDFDGSPEVYWEKEVIDKNESYFESCSDINHITKIVNNEDTKTSKYFSFECLYDNDATLKMNGVEPDKNYKNFDATHGFDVLLNLKIKANCSYKLDENKYSNVLKEYEDDKKLCEKNANDSLKELEEDLHILQEEANRETDETKKNEINTRIQGYNESIERTKNLLNECDAVYQEKREEEAKIFKNAKEGFSTKVEQDKYNFENKFQNVKAELTVNEGSKKNTVLLIDKGDTVENIPCNIYTNNTVCSGTFEKNLMLPKTCINIQSGEMVGIGEDKCNSLSDVLNGYNKYYPNLNSGSGTIALNVSNVFTSGDEITLKGEDCSYGVTKKKIVYREIDVSDPFNQTLGTREVGKNWKGIFNFVNLIKKDIWNPTIEYTNVPRYIFKLSKNNVLDIKKDNNDASNSVVKYTGSNCYFYDNEVKCPFVDEYLEKNK